MAHSKLALIALLGLAACAAAEPKPTPPSPSAAPTPREYNCDQNRQASVEFSKLPAGSMLRVFMDDYRIERKQLRAFHNMPEPNPCGNKS